MNLDKFAADILEALLKDLRDTFPSIDSRMLEIEADLYGWLYAKAEALADRLKTVIRQGETAMILQRMHEAADKRLRDEFAMRAPKKVPSWFTHTPPPGKPGELPEPDLKDPELEPGYDQLTHEQQTEKRNAYGEAYNRLWHEQKPLRDEHYKAVMAWKLADEVARLTQWRWFYADQMLAARNPEPQPVTVEAKT